MISEGNIFAIDYQDLSLFDPHVQDAKFETLFDDAKKQHQDLSKGPPVDVVVD